MKNSSKKKIIILIAVAILSICITNAANIKFYNVNTLYGTSMRITNAVCKDNYGFIWVSSKTGILRLTEDDYRIYQLPYATANFVTVNLIYKNSILLAYTNNGQVFRYNAVRDRFELLINIGSALKNKLLGVSSILIDDENNIWIASAIGLYRYMNNQLSMIGNDSSSIHYAIWYNNHQMIVAQGNNFLMIDTKSLKIKSVFKNTDTSTFKVSKLFLDKEKDRLWIGTISSGLFYYDFKAGIFRLLKIPALPKQPILAIESISDVSLLIGIDGQGIWEINKKGDRVLNIYKDNSDDPSSLHGNGIYDIFCDQNNHVWICTISDGVSFFELASPIVNHFIHQPNDANSLVNNDVNGIIEASDGKIWFATNNGISFWDVASGQWKNLYSNKLEQAQVFLALGEDSQGRIWAGSYSSGIYVLDGKTGQELAHYSWNENDLSSVSNFILDIFKDSQGDLWIGGVNGKFACYLSKENKFKIYTEESISSFAELSPNQIILGCNHGILLLNKQTGEIKNFLSSYLVQDIFVLGDIIWVCTSGEGLLEYNLKNGMIIKYTTQNGLPSNFINSITYADNCLWIGTENGLCSLNPNDKKVLSFSSTYPLSGISYNKSALFRLKNGQLACGTNIGALIFDPKAIQQFQSKGKIFLQDLSISGCSIREHSLLKLETPLDDLKEIRLKYNQNTLTIELLPIGVTAGSKFSWKLEGLDKDWTQPTSHRMLTYANIPSKDFSLKIRMYNNSLSQIIAERTLSIYITPPFWNKWWFVLLVFIIVSTIIYLVLRYYSNILKQQHNEAKIRFFTNTAHDFRTSLTLIKAPIEELTKEKNLSESGNYYLHLATEQARRLSSIVTQLMDFQKVDIGKEQLSFVMTDIVKFIEHRIPMFESFAKSKDIKLTFNSDLSNYISVIDEILMGKVIDNLISNAVKYSAPNNYVHIELKCEESKWILKVKDYGIGISKRAQQQLFREFYRSENAINSRIIGSGIGLLLVKNYVLLHGGNVSCSSQENVGSTFQIVIPYKKLIEEPNISVQIRKAEPSISFSSIDLQSVNKQEEISAKKMRILIVEDNDDLCNFMHYTLKEDFEVYTSVDGLKAWQIIQKQTFDLVVSDVIMPNMDGFELCHLMKSTYETSHIPVVLLTSLSEKAEQLNGLGLGADDYLTKPFDMALLQQKLKSILQNREAIRLKALKLIRGNINEPILVNELNDQFIKKMLEVVRANISNTDFGKDEFASAMNVSSSLLYKKTKFLTDQSPVDFVKSVRLNYALELLQTRKYIVTEVSELCGFASVGYFGSVFKKYYGKSPTEAVE